MAGIPGKTMTIPPVLDPYMTSSYVQDGFFYYTLFDITLKQPIGGIPAGSFFPRVCIDFCDGTIEFYNIPGVTPVRVVVQFSVTFA